MPVIKGRLVTLRAATEADMISLEHVFATIRDVSYITRVAPRPDHPEQVAKSLADSLKDVKSDSEVHFAAIEGAQFCGVLNVYGIDLHHRTVR